jgi:HAMP domain-containing protein
LRTRVIAACALFLVGLSFVLGLALPRVFDTIARESLRERTRSMASGAAFHLRNSDGATVEDLGHWLQGEVDFEAVAITDARGRVRSSWPTGHTWSAPVPPGERVTESEAHFVATVPLGRPGSDTSIAVRTSTERLRTELTSIVGLFLSLLLFGAAWLFVLTGYLVRAVLAPLEEIHQAAQHLADGELYVSVRRSGDPEIDELGELISQLGDERRASLSKTEDPLEVIQHLPAEPSGPAGYDRRQGDRRRTPDPTLE